MTDPTPPAGRARGTYPKGVARRQEILDAAIEVFAQRGADRTSLRAIAQEVGVTHAALIHHFGSLERLLVEVYVEAERRLDRDAPHPPDLSPVEVMRRSADRNHGLPGLVQLYTSLTASALEEGHEAAREFATRRFAAVRAGLAERIAEQQGRGSIRADVDPAAVAALVIAASDGLQTQWRLDPTVDQVGALALLDRLLKGGGAGVGGPEYGPAMDPRQLFLSSDAALRGVVDRIRPEDLDRPAPAEWSSSIEHPVLRDIVAAHAYDEAWVPDVLAGKGLADGDPWRDADLLGDDPVAGYDAVQDRAMAAVEQGVAAGTVFRFQYGDYPAEEGFVHLAAYRAFQAWDIAHLLDLDFRLGPDLVAGFEQHVLPHVDEWRSWGVFPPAVEAPADADAETRLLATLGFWKP